MRSGVSTLPKGQQKLDVSVSRSVKRGIRGIKETVRGEWQHLHTTSSAYHACQGVEECGIQCHAPDVISNYLAGDGDDLADPNSNKLTERVLELNEFSRQGSLECLKG